MAPLIKDWETFTERVIAGVASGLTVGLILIYLLPGLLAPAITAELQKQGLTAYIRGPEPVEEELGYTEVEP